MTIAEQLNQLNHVKNTIRDSIRLKGVDVPKDSTFFEYGGYIRDINGEKKDILTVYENIGITWQPGYNFLTTESINVEQHMVSIQDLALLTYD